MAEVKFDIVFNAEQAQEIIKRLSAEIKNFNALIAQAPQAVPPEIIANYAKLGEEIRKVTGKITDNIDVTHSARVVMLNLNYVIRDLPYGLIGITNNIDMLVQRFTDLIRVGGGVRGALQLLGQQLIGPSGLVLAFSGLTSALTFYALSARRGRDETDELVERFGTVAEKIKEVEKEVGEIGKTIERIRFEPEIVFRVDTSELFRKRAEIELEINRLISQISKALMVEPIPSLPGLGALLKPLLGIGDVDKLSKSLQGLNAVSNQLTSAIDAVLKEQKKLLELAEKFVESLNLENLGISKTIKNLEALREALILKRNTLEIGSEGFKKYTQAIEKLDEILKNAKGTTKETVDTNKELEDEIQNVEKRFKLWVDALKIGAVRLDEAKPRFDELLKILEELDKRIEELSQRKIITPEEAERLRLLIKTLTVEIETTPTKINVERIREDIEKRIKEIEKDIEEEIKRARKPLVEFEVEFKLLMLEEGRISQEELLKRLNELKEKLEKIKVDVSIPLEVRIEADKLLKDIDNAIKNTERGILSAQEGIFDMTRVMERSFSRSFDFIVSEWTRTWARNKNVFMVFLATMMDEMLRQVAKNLGQLLSQLSSGKSLGKGSSEGDWASAILGIAGFIIGLLTKTGETQPVGIGNATVNLNRVNEISNLAQGNIVRSIPRVNFSLQMQTQSLENALIRVEKAIKEQKAQINILLDKKSLSREIAPEILKYNRFKEI